MWQVKTVHQIKDLMCKEIKMSSLLKSEKLIAKKRVFVRTSSHTIFEEPNELLSYTLSSTMCDLLHLILTKSTNILQKAQSAKIQDALGNATNLIRKCERPKVYDTF
jgi:hypothetical protein